MSIIAHCKNLSWKTLGLTVISANLIFNSNFNAYAQDTHSVVDRETAKELLLNGEKFNPIPGVHDPLSALILEKQGGKFAVLSGYALSAAYYGKPDIGYVNATDLVDTANRITSATPNLALIIDGDTGHGGPNQVRFLIQQLERSEALGVMLEDQVSPKRCGHMEGKAVIPMKDQVAKIRAAVASRTDPNFIIIARTDARGVTGLDDAIIRANAYRAAGADMIFVEAPLSKEELKRIAKEVDAPLIANMLEGGKTPILSSEELHNMGYNAAYYPLQHLNAATTAMSNTYHALITDQNGRVNTAPDAILFSDFNTLVGLDEANHFEDDMHMEK